MPSLVLCCPGELSLCFGDVNTQSDEFRRIDPLHDRSWDMLLAGCERSSIFLTSAWALVLHESYGHTPFYFASGSNSKLNAFCPVMEVSSHWTGRRGVSLPFTDYCPFVGATAAGREALSEQVLKCGRERGWRYFESRSNDFACPGAEPSVGFYGHAIDLKGNAVVLFAKCEGAVRRGIRKAEQAGLRVEFGVSEKAMQEYYSLHCQTRRKHGVPPQPRRFFESIQRHVIGAGHGFVASVRFEGRPIAASVFFHCGSEAVYKFGASDHKFQHLRANNLLMWESMKRCAELGSESLHLGRTSLGQEGLRRFKLGFGAVEERLNYFRYDYARQAFVAGVDRASSRVTQLFKWLPGPLFRLAGRLLYPHLS